MRLLPVAFVWLLTKTCTWYRGVPRKIGVWLGKYFRKQTISQKSVYRIAKYHLPHDKMLTISPPPPPPLWWPLFIVIYKGGKSLLRRLKNRHFWTGFFFSLALRFRSKLKQVINISPVVNHFTLKNPRVLDTAWNDEERKQYCLTGPLRQS